MVRNAVAHQGDLIYRIEQLERKLQERTSGRKLTSSSIGNGGLRIIDNGFLEVDGGELRLLAENGVTVARWGDTYYGDWSRGWEFFYPSGSRAFIMGGTTANPAIVTYDVAGNVVFATDAASRNGVARPYVNYRLVPTYDAEQDGTRLVPSTTSSTPTRLWYGINSIWHPRLKIGVHLSGSGAGTTGHWRLAVNGTNVISDETSSGAFEVGIPGWGDTIKPGDEASIDVYGWVTGGTGRMWPNVDRCIGKQS